MKSLPSARPANASASHVARENALEEETVEIEIEEPDDFEEYGSEFTGDLGPDEIYETSRTSRQSLAAPAMRRRVSVREAARF